MEREKHKHLLAAEMSEEGNYNMVDDGIINNVQKPSITEQIREYESQKAEQNADAAKKSKENER